MRTLRACLFAAVVVLVSAAAFAAQQLLPTKTLLVKNPPSGARKALWKVRESASAATVVGDPTIGGASLHLVLAPGGDQCINMPASGWSPIGSIGFRYSDSTLANGPVRVAQIKKTPSGNFLIKAVLKNGGPTPIGVVPGGPSTSYAVNFAMPSGDEYCGGSAGAIPNPNNATTFKVSNDGAPAGCAAACTPPPTGISTTSTSTTSTTSTTIGGPCCNGDGFVSFTSAAAVGDCGDVLNQFGALFRNIECSGVYSGGGGNAVPLPYQWPDLGQQVLAIGSCVGQLATLGPTTSTQTGSDRNCTDAGCFFEAPLPIPNVVTTPTSTCVVQRVTGTVSGSLNCSSGGASVTVPLGWDVHLTGDTLAAPGIQPCPLCSAGACLGGPNNGMTCTPATSILTDSYPTSHDCPPVASLSVGTLPIAFVLSSGTVSWTATPATNDTDVGLFNQPRVFSGYCRDVDFTGDFESPAHPCWENGMPVGVACSGVYETCEQRVNGAFGPNGGSSRTITAIGSTGSLVPGPAAATLVTAFSIPPSFNATVDASHDFPGPGAVAIPGTLETCAAANPCP
jgi:hypothetical protein